MKKNKILRMTSLAVLLTLNLHAQGLDTQHSSDSGEKSNLTQKIKPRYQGVVVEVLDAKAYTYLKIDEKNPGYDPKKLKSFWIVVNNSAVNVGDYVRFQKELVAKNFKSDTLNRTFDEVMFASELEYRVSK